MSECKDCLEKYIDNASWAMALQEFSEKFPKEWEELLFKYYGKKADNLEVKS
jgi:hypothetical protein